MKKSILTLFCLVSGLSSLAAQTIIDTDGFGRYQVNDYLTTKSFSSGSWGPGTGTFGFDPGGNGDNTWAQFLQFDTDGLETEFGSATEFSLTLSTDFASGSRSFSVFANAGNNDIAAAGAGFNLINNTTGVSGNVALEGTAIATGLTNSGSFTIANAQLDTFLSNLDYGSNRYVYFTFIGDTASTAGGTVSLNDSTLAAIPEPTTYVLIFAMASLGVVLIRRWRR